MQQVSEYLEWMPTVIGILVMIGAIKTYREELKAWNYGVCRENGLPWTHFDSDSHGGRGYMAGDVYMWISWGADKLQGASIWKYIESLWFIALIDLTLIFLPFFA